jgi:hypothetical protein
MPWWHGYIEQLRGNLWIRPWALQNDLGILAAYIAGSDMPGWFAPLMWIYLGLCVSTLLASLFIKDKTLSLSRFKVSLPQFLIGIAGLSYIVVVVLAVIVAAIRTGDFHGVHLIGYTFVVVGPEGTGVQANLLWGYWLACGVGPLLILLSLLHNKIIGHESRR